MNKVTTINLNGTAYQVEENGYEALSTYLAQAGAKLEGNPDREEIMRDFEQAVAEKFQAYLSTSKNVIMSEEVQKIIKEMGPVESEKETDEKSAPKNAGAHTYRRAFRIHEGAVVMGVCNGLATYFDVDVLLVRLAFIALAMLTSGGFILLYVLLGIFMPYANTHADATAGEFATFNTQEFIQQAQNGYAELRNRKEWKRWHRAMRRGTPWSSSYSPTPVAPYLFPFINLLRVVIIVLFIVALGHLFSYHSFAGIVFMNGWSIALVAILIFAAFRFLQLPVQWAKYRAYAGAPTPSSRIENRQYISAMIWHAVASVIWFIGILALVWAAYFTVPSIHRALDREAAAIQQSIN